MYDSSKPVWAQYIEELEPSEAEREARQKYREAVNRATDIAIEKIRALKTA